MKRNKYRIAVDVDGILNDLMEKMIEFFNQKYNKNYTIDMISEYDLSKVFLEDWKLMTNLFLERTLWDSLKPTEHSQNSIKELINKGYEVYLITATNPINFPWKVEWIKIYFPEISTKNIICACDKSIFNVDFMIDDCLDNLIGNRLCERIVLDKPWNRNINDDIYCIHRAMNWKEIVDLINFIVHEIENSEI